MKKLVTISLALVLSISAFSQTSGIGIGAELGTVVDFTAKFWTSETTAVALAAGFDWGGYGGLHVNGDFLFHLWSFDVGQDMMKVYFGPGVGLGYAMGNYYWGGDYWNDYSRVWFTLRAPGVWDIISTTCPWNALWNSLPELTLLAHMDLISVGTAMSVPAGISKRFPV